MYVDLHVKIACGAAACTCFAFACEADAIAGVDAGWHFNGEGFGFFFAAVAVAFATRVADDAAFAATAGAGLLYGEEALLHSHLTHTAAGGAGGGRGARFRAGAFAGVARDEGGHFDFYGGAFYGVF